MMNRGRWLGVIVCMSMVMMSGCASFNQRGGYVKGEMKTLDVAPLLKFDDIPIPTSFSLLRDQSFTFQNDTVRVGLLRYIGKASPEQTIAFYKDQMGLYNWRLINTVEFERTVMTFEKDDALSVITIDPLRGKLILTITLSPKQ